MASSLSSKVLSIQALLIHFTTLIKDKGTITHTDAVNPPDNPANPLHVIRDSVTLIKSHTTKLGLLLITPPFTPSAIQTVLQPCEIRVIPAMMSGWQILSNPSQSSTRFLGGEVVREEIRSELKDVVSGFETVLLLVQEKLSGTNTAASSRSASAASKKGTEDYKARVLATTGILWDACDNLIATIALDIPGIVAKKVEQFRATLDDAIEELREWGTVREKTPPASDDDDDDEDEDDAVRSDNEDTDEQEEKYLDPLEGTLESLPAHRADLRALHFTTMKELRLTSTFMRAVVKHRVKTLPKAMVESQSCSTTVRGLDALVLGLGNIPDMVDDLAAALYEGEVEDVDAQLREVVKHVRRIAASVKIGIEPVEPARDSGSSVPQADAFSTWVDKWDAAVADALSELKV